MTRTILVNIAFLVSSFQISAMSAEVHNFKQITQFPSASASIFSNGLLYAVGDDSPNLYTLDNAFNIIHQTTIQNDKAGEDGRIAGNLKADLEGAELFDIDGKPTLIFMGSGTYTDTREKALIYSLNDKTATWRNVKPLYRSLRKVANLNKNEFINIEGLAANESFVFLISRGSHGPNLIFTFDKKRFIDYITSEKDALAPISVQKVKLARLNGFEATLSGATWHTESQTLMVTASVDSDNKGAILGSFIAGINANELANTDPIDLSNSSLRLQHNNKPLMSKVESIVVTATNGKSIQGVLAADNDDGTSQFMSFEMTLK